MFEKNVHAGDLNCSVLDTIATWSVTQYELRQCSELVVADGDSVSSYFALTFVGPGAQALRAYSNSLRNKQTPPI